MTQIIDTVLILLNYAIIIAFTLSDDFDVVMHDGFKTHSELTFYAELIKITVPPIKY